MQLIYILVETLLFLLHWSLDNWRSSGDEAETSRGNNNNSKSSSLTRNIPTISGPYHPGTEGESVGTGGGGGGGAGDEEYYEEEGGWSSGEFSNTDDEQLDEQYIPKIEVGARTRVILGFSHRIAL